MPLCVANQTFLCCNRQSNFPHLSNHLPKDTLMRLYLAERIFYSLAAQLYSPLKRPYSLFVNIRRWTVRPFCFFSFIPCIEDVEVCSKSLQEKYSHGSKLSLHTRYESRLNIENSYVKQNRIWLKKSDGLCQNVAENLNWRSPTVISPRCFKCPMWFRNTDLLASSA